MHYAAEPIKFDRARQYVQGGLRSRVGKPNDFWVSVEGEDDWEWWCRSEGFGVDRLTNAHEVTLAADANILYIGTPEAIDDFHNTFSAGTELIPGRPTYREIDWAFVATLWDGIIIAPHQWSRHFDGPFWYYGWDCASGCIWNLDAIASVQLVTEAVAS